MKKNLVTKHSHYDVKHKLNSRKPISSIIDSLIHIEQFVAVSSFRVYCMSMRPRCCENSQINIPDVLAHSEILATASQDIKVIA